MGIYPGALLVRTGVQMVAAMRETAVQAVRTVGRDVRSPEFLRAVIRALADDRGWVRHAAIRTVHAMGRAAAVEEFLVPLGELLEHPASGVKIAAAEAVAG